jgi:hypothetical protein
MVGEVARFAAGDWGRLLVPAFEWGDKSKLEKYLLGKPNHYVDVSIYAPLHEIERKPSTERYGAWILGTLSKQSKAWADEHMTRCKWPVKTFGSARSKWATASVKEPELVQYYADCWGVVATPYAMHPGSGWWRNRYTYAAQCESILYTDPRDAERIGPEYLIDLEAVEKMRGQELVDVAQAQRQRYKSWEWPKERVGESIVEALRGAWQDVNS